jgi:NTE family protein
MATQLKSEFEQFGQVVLVFQGGGALGAYQAGVYQALHEAGVEPDWVIGTSIGAINAALIAGNSAANRLDRLRAFWTRMEHGHVFDTPLGALLNPARTMAAIAGGIPAFFKPNPFAFMSPFTSLGAEGAGYYSTEPLKATLADLIDFDLLNDGPCRIAVGAANVRTSEMRYFDSNSGRIDARHIMASGALPPAFPAVRIDDELYWDGGIVSNTPVEAVFDDEPRRDSLVFAVHLWNPHGAEPENIWQVMNRQKDVQYASRAASHIRRQRQIHRLRHVINELGKLVPAQVFRDANAEDLMHYACQTRMHVVRLLAPALDGEDHSKDVDFSPSSIKERWESGYEHTRDTLRHAPWRGAFDPLEGFILHEAMGGKLVDVIGSAKPVAA